MQSCTHSDLLLFPISFRSLQGAVAQKSVENTGVGFGAGAKAQGARVAGQHLPGNKWVGPRWDPGEEAGRLQPWALPLNLGFPKEMNLGKLNQELGDTMQVSGTVQAASSRTVRVGAARGYFPRSQQRPRTGSLPGVSALTDVPLSLPPAPPRPTFWKTFQAKGVGEAPLQ